MLQVLIILLHWLELAAGQVARGEEFRRRNELSRTLAIPGSAPKRRVGRALDAAPVGTVEHMGVDDRGLPVLVTHKVLDRARIVSGMSVTW